MSAVDSSALAGQGLVDREILRVRLERAIRAALERTAGSPLRLVETTPEPGSHAEEHWARDVDRLRGIVPELVVDEVAAARSDLVAALGSDHGPLAREALGRLDGALAGRARELEQGHGPSRPERDHLRTLRATAGYEGSLEALVVGAELEIQVTGEAMDRVAYSAGAGSAIAFVERLKEQGSREETLELAQEEAERSARFARDHGVVTVPEGVFENLTVEVGPGTSRTPFGHYVPLGTRGPRGFYVVTDPVGHEPEAISRRRESYRAWLRGVSAHEGVPGHHLHFSAATRSSDELLHLPYEGATTEGWGLFVEGALARAGYFSDSPEARLTPLRMRRWRALRVVLDLGLRTGRLGRPQAVARLQRDLGFDRAIAADEVERYVERPGYISGYLLGALLFERLEREAETRGGPEAGRRLRDRILALGPATPLAAVERLALDERVPAVVK